MYYGKGLSVFLLIYEYIKRNMSTNGVLFVLNLNEEDSLYLIELLGKNHFKMQILNKVPKTLRNKKYLELNCVFLSS